MPAPFLPRTGTRTARKEAGGSWARVCHFLDLMQFLCGSPPVSSRRPRFPGTRAPFPRRTSSPSPFASPTAQSARSTTSPTGDKAIPKESLEVFGGGKTFLLDDFRRARFAAGGKIMHWKLRAQDKGQRAELRAPPGRHHDRLAQSRPTPRGGPDHTHHLSRPRLAPTGERATGLVDHTPGSHARMNAPKVAFGQLCESRRNNFDFMRFALAALVIASHARMTVVLDTVDRESGSWAQAALRSTGSS